MGILDWLESLYPDKPFQNRGWNKYANSKPGPGVAAAQGKPTGAVSRSNPKSPLPGLGQNVSGGFSRILDIAQGLGGTPSTSDGGGGLTPEEAIFQDLLRRANGLPTPQRGSASSYMNEATSAVDPQFSAILQGIRDQQAAAQAQTAKDQDIAVRMYNALGQEYSRLGSEYTQMQPGIQAGVADIYQKGMEEFKAQNAAQDAANAENYARLGLAGAEQQVDADRQARRDSQLKDIITSQGAAATTAGQQAANFGRYFNEQGGISQAMGINARTDLANKLTRYMLGSNQQINETQAQRAAAILDYANSLADTGFQNQKSAYESELGRLGAIGDVYKLFGMDAESQAKAAQDSAIPWQEKGGVQRTITQAMNGYPHISEEKIAQYVKFIQDHARDPAVEQLAATNGLNAYSFANHINSMNRSRAHGGIGLDSQILNTIAQYYANNMGITGSYIDREDVRNAFDIPKIGTGTVRKGTHS